MAVYRNLHLSFWTDNKVVDEFTPEDKYFYLYLLTNPQTNICGCYEVSYSQITNQTGYSKDTVNRLLNRFDTVHSVIRFNKETKEILVLHWYKYNWIKSEKVLTGVESVAKHIKCDEFREYVFGVLENFKNDNEVKEECQRVKSDNSSATNKNEDIDTIKNIVDYLNLVCGTKYRHKILKTQTFIRARIREGFKEDDFKEVIDKKSKEWKGTEMEKYLRPETLFGTKFESYLNQNITKGSNKNSYTESIENRVKDVDKW